jgi:hypothetical protein
VLSDVCYQVQEVLEMTSSGDQAEARMENCGASGIMFVSLRFGYNGDSRVRWAFLKIIEA